MYTRTIRAVYKYGVCIYFLNRGWRVVDLLIGPGSNIAVRACYNDTSRTVVIPITDFNYDYSWNEDEESIERR